MPKYNKPHTHRGYAPNNKRPPDRQQHNAFERGFTPIRPPNFTFQPQPNQFYFPQNPNNFQNNTSNSFFRPITMPNLQLDPNFRGYFPANPVNNYFRPPNPNPNPHHHHNNRKRKNISFANDRNTSVDTADIKPHSPKRHKFQKRKLNESSLSQGINFNIPNQVRSNKPKRSLSRNNGKKPKTEPKNKPNGERRNSKDLDQNTSTGTEKTKIKRPATDEEPAETKPTSPESENDSDDQQFYDNNLSYGENLHPDMHSFDYNLPNRIKKLKSRNTNSRHSLRNSINLGRPIYAPSNISYDAVSNSNYNLMTTSQQSSQSKKLMSRSMKSNKSHRASSPNGSLRSDHTNATFKNDLKENQFLDMFNEFRKNDLNNMERNQVLQEYFFMERVNSFLDEKLYLMGVNHPELLIEKNSSSASGTDSKSKINKQPSELSKSSETSNNSVINTPLTSVTSSNDLETYVDLLSHKRPIPLDKTEIQLEKDLNDLGIDPTSNIEEIKNYIDMIELQLKERTRQLSSEKISLEDKLEKAIKSLNEIKKNLAEN